MAPKRPANRTEVRVFLSSTYRDLKEQRDVLFTAIQRIGMRVSGMELFVAEARPTVEQCERAVCASHVFVGVLGHRYGWIPDGLSISITQREYELAGELGLPRLMFLIDPKRPVVPERDFDEPPHRGKKQDLLDAFKHRVQAEKRETHSWFESDSDLASGVTGALITWFDDLGGGSSPRETARARNPRIQAGTTALDAEIDAYRSKLVAELSELHLAGFSQKVRVKLRFDDLFVAQHALRDERFTGEDSFAHGKHAERELGRFGRPIPFVDAFREAAQRKKRHGVVLLGDPGSGKTTQLRRVALWLASQSASVLGLPEGALPILLPLRKVTRTDRPLLELVDAHLAESFGTSAGFAGRLAASRPLAFLLDGLDEVRDPELRGAVARWLRTTARELAEHRFALTCRYAGYGGEAALGPDFLVLHLSPLTDEQAREFVLRWFTAVELTGESEPEHARAVAARSAEKLSAQLERGGRRSARVAELTQNPLLLTAICLVHHDQKALPEKRADLLEECVQVLLERWRRAKEVGLSFDAKQARAVLQTLAYWMHSEPNRERASAEEIAPQLREALRAIQWKGGDEHSFLRTIRDESGLLVGWSDRDFGFLHLAFQEYLAAREIRRRYFELGDAGVLRELAERFGESWWREVTLLLLALEDPALFEPLFREVVELPAFAGDQELVDDCLVDAVRVAPQPFLDLLGRAPGEDRDLHERQLAALRVVEKIAPDALAPLAQQLASHPRLEIAQRFERPAARQVERIRRADLELVMIPGGAFDMGAPKRERGSDETERPLHRVELAPFLLGSTPVTNEQYARFLEANPHAPKPGYWADRNFNQPQQPVVGVSWEEARAYCHWIGGDLPTEAQWEYACRAGTSTAYWSGADEDHLELVGWYAGNSGSRLHAVAEKPANPWGLFDMHGNVWEWCRDWFGKYPSKLTRDPEGPASGSDRVIRGGSFGSGAVGCRSAARGRNLPGDRWYDLGFRVALPAAPSSVRGSIIDP